MQELKIDTTPLNPIYQEMGAAVQDSQRIELYISLMMTLLIDLSEGALSDEEFDGVLESQGAQTLGKLIEEIRRRVGFTDEAVRQLRNALRCRNFLIHRFYNLRSDLLLSQAGREKALSEIRQKRVVINRATDLLNPVLTDLIGLKGIDLDQVKGEVLQRFER